MRPMGTDRPGPAGTRGRTAPLPVAVVGNGGAAAHAVMALRDSGYSGRIDLFGDSGEPVCNPMLLPYYIAGEIDRSACHPFGVGDSFYQRYDVRHHLSEPVVALDAGAHTLDTAAGRRLEWDRCLVATGSSAVRPTLEGVEDDRVHTLRSLVDAERLRTALRAQPRRAVVVGASMVGIKVVEVLCRADVDTLLCDAEPQVFPLAASGHCAGVVEERLAARGVALRLGERLSGIESGRTGLRVYLDAGDPEDADLVVLALGVRPNLDLIDRSQVAVDAGLLVDEHLQTSVAGLYAAGDVAQGINLLTGRRELIGLWASACTQGRCAGRNLAGHADEYVGGVPSNVVHFFDSLFVAIGDARATRAGVEIVDPQAQTYCRLAEEGGRLVGVNLLDCCRPAGMLRQAIVRGLSPAASARLDWAEFCRRLYAVGDEGSILWSRLGKELDT